MREILERRNKQLLQNLQALNKMLNESTIPPELQSYNARILQVCNLFEETVSRNLNYLKKGQDSILEDVLSNTQQAARYVQLLSARFSVPIKHASESDRLTLRIIAWLHQSHPKTRNYPPAFSNDSFAMWPFKTVSPIYFFPCLEQDGLLYQSLLFHEFGHLLYACYEEEMDQLVKDLRLEIADKLIPASQRNDEHSKEQAKQALVITNTWYRWIQELFCDAVGFIIGGPCFLQAFSSFLGTLDRGDFYRQPQHLQLSQHPVTWLRIKFLAERARKTGFSKLAEEVEQEWFKISQVIGIKEDYHGFYHKSLAKTITRTLDDMLEEASPRPFTGLEANGQGWLNSEDTPVRLLNWAWQTYKDNPDEYGFWEKEQMDLFIENVVAS